MTAPDPNNAAIFPGHKTVGLLVAVIVGFDTTTDTVFVPGQPIPLTPVTV